MSRVYTDSQAGDEALPLETKVRLSLEPIVVPEPKDATSILLQANALSNLSEKIRVQAKSNSAWISGSVSALQTFCSEQEQARGNFPGPVPAC